MTESLTGRALDRALAEAMGLETHGKGEDTALTTGGLLPRWHSSIDALVSGPEKKLREVGFYFEVGSSVGEESVRGAFSATWWVANGDEIADAQGDTEAEARARACLAALQALSVGAG